MLYTISMFTSILAGTLQLLGYYTYNRMALSGKIVPNTASWLIWAIGGVLTTISYVFVSGDWVKDILPIVCSLSAVLIFLFCLVKGRFQRIDAFEWTVIGLDISVTIYWYLSSDTFVTNVLYILSAFPSFIPIIRYVWKNPLSENATPWILWSSAYLLMMMTVIIRFEKWQDIFYPIALFALHIIIAILSSDYIAKRRINSKTFKKTAIDNI